MDEGGPSEKGKMSSQICLKWNSFLNNIATSFESLWEEEGLVDVTLASDGQCLTAHKVILSASSPFFKKVFQTNPCQHPVIILQDVHFSELEALLIFIYKGEVNIEQKNLPALLKAAETLQIRGLSGGDIFARESYKRLLETERATNENEENEDNEEDDNVSASPENQSTQKKRRKIAKTTNNSILEKALTPGVSRPASACESTSSQISPKDEDLSNSEPDQVLNPVYHRLEMKIEPYELTVEELQKQDIKEELERLDTGQENQVPSTSRATLTIIPEARDVPERSIDPETSNRENFVLASHDETKISRVNDRVTDCQETLNFNPEPGISRSSIADHSRTENSSIIDEHDGHNSVTKGSTTYPPFPCPFCDRAYTSWGFRRRHIKAVHTISPKLNCKWCSQVLPTHAAWRRHVISAHNLSASDAHNGLLILEEAHMVLQIANPTRLDTLVNIIKQSSQQSGEDRRENEPHPD